MSNTRAKCCKKALPCSAKWQCEQIPGNTPCFYAMSVESAGSAPQREFTIVNAWDDPEFNNGDPWEIKFPFGTLGRFQPLFNTQISPCLFTNFDNIAPTFGVGEFQGGDMSTLGSHTDHLGWQYVGNLKRKDGEGLVKPWLVADDLRQRAAIWWRADIQRFAVAVWVDLFSRHGGEQAIAFYGEIEPQDMPNFAAPSGQGNESIEVQSIFGPGDIDSLWEDPTGVVPGVRRVAFADNALRIRAACEGLSFPGTRLQIGFHDIQPCTECETIDFTPSTGKWSWKWKDHDLASLMQGPLRLAFVSAPDIFPHGRVNIYRCIDERFMSATYELWDDQLDCSGPPSGTETHLGSTSSISFSVFSPDFSPETSSVRGTRAWAHWYHRFFGDLQFTDTTSSGTFAKGGGRTIFHTVPRGGQFGHDVKHFNDVRCEMALATQGITGDGLVNNTIPYRGSFGRNRFASAAFGGHAIITPLDFEDEPCVGEPGDLCPPATAKCPHIVGADSDGFHLDFASGVGCTHYAFYNTVGEGNSISAGQDLLLLKTANPCVYRGSRPPGGVVGYARCKDDEPFVGTLHAVYQITGPQTYFTRVWVENLTHGEEYDIVRHVGTINRLNNVLQRFEAYAVSTSSPAPPIGFETWRYRLQSICPDEEDI